MVHQKSHFKNYPQITSICYCPAVGCDANVLHLAHVILESLAVFLVQGVDPSHASLVLHHYLVDLSCQDKVPEVFRAANDERYRIHYDQVDNLLDNLLV